VNVGVVGTGFGRRIIAPVFAETEGCAVVDVVSARDERAVVALAARADVDLISVHSPPFLHAAHVRAALAAGKAVLCDKPFALTPDEARELEAAATEAGVVALCNFEFRYAPARELLRALVHDGTLGTIEHIQWTHHSAGSRVPRRAYGWLFDRERGGGWVGAWASHAVDTVRFVFDAEIVATDAQLRTDISERPDGQGVMHACTAEDGMIATLGLDTGATVTFDSSFAAVANLPPRLTVFGSNGVVELVADRHVTVWHADGEHEAGEVGAVGEDRHLEPMRRYAVVVRDAVHTSEIPEFAPTFADGRACDDILARLRTGEYRSRRAEQRDHG
jgi:predicted dehydrogenase